MSMLVHGVIYALSDPRTLDVRYVGRTVNIERRVYGHIHRAKSHPPGRPVRHSTAWIRDLLSNGLEPYVAVLEESDYTREDFKHAEYRWIERLREYGCDLTNHSQVIDGVQIYDEESRRRVSEGNKRAHADGTAAARARETRLANGGYVLSADARRRISQTLREGYASGRIVSARGMLGKSLSEESRALVREKLVGRTTTSYTRQKLSESKTRTVRDGEPVLSEKGYKIRRAALKRFRSMPAEERNDLGLKMSLGRRLAKAKRNGWCLTVLQCDRPDHPDTVQERTQLWWDNATEEQREARRESLKHAWERRGGRTAKERKRDSEASAAYWASLTPEERDAKVIRMKLGKRIAAARRNGWFLGETCPGGKR